MMDNDYIFSEDSLHQQLANLQGAYHELEQKYTKLLASEQALSASKAQLKSIVASLDDIVFELDEHYHFINAWTSEPSTLFMPPEMFIGKHIDEVFGDGFAHPFKILIDIAQQTGQKQKIEYESPLGDGKWFEASIYRLLEHEDGASHISMVIKDITERNKAKQNLLKVNQRLSLLEKFIDKSTDAIQVCDEGGQMMYMNDAASIQLGVPKNEIGNYKAQEFDPALSTEESRQAYLRLLKVKGKRVVESIYTNRTTAEQIPIEATVSYEVIDGQGYIIAILRDITERKRTEKELYDQNLKLISSKEKTREAMSVLKKQHGELQDANAHIKAITNALDNSAIVSIADLSGKIIKINRIFCKVSGYSEAELIGQNHRLLNSGWHPEDFWISMWTSIVQGQTWRAEVKNEAKDGRYYWVDTVITPIFDREGGIYQYLSVSHLITDKKIAEANIRLQNEELQASEEELKQATENLVAINTALQASEEELRRNEGWLMTLNNQLVEEKKHVEEALTDLLHAEQRALRSEKMASLGVLTAGIAHEINNPMNFISGGTQALTPIIDELLLLLDYYALLEVAKEEKARQAILQKLNALKNEIGSMNELKKGALNLFHGIKEGVDRVTNIVKSLSSLSRGDAGILAPSNLHESLESALLILHGKCKDRITVVKKLDYGIGAVNCYSGQLGQVFLNLLSNAIDAIENEGVVTITTKSAGNTVQVSIQDTGGGIPNDIRGKIFDPFFTTKEVGKGMGLGLSIVYGIIEKHHGQINVHSEIGKGTEFLITLPT